MWNTSLLTVGSSPINASTVRQWHWCACSPLRPAHWRPQWETCTVVVAVVGLWVVWWSSAVGGLSWVDKDEEARPAGNRDTEEESPADCCIVEVCRGDVVGVGRGDKEAWPVDSCSGDSLVPRDEGRFVFLVRLEEIPSCGECNRGIPGKSFGMSDSCWPSADKSEAKPLEWQRQRWRPNAANS